MGACRGRRRTAWVEGIRKGIVAIVVVVKERLGEWRWKSLELKAWAGLVRRAWLSLVENLGKLRSMTTIYVPHFFPSSLKKNKDAAFDAIVISKDIDFTTL